MIIKKSTYNLILLFFMSFVLGFQSYGQTPYPPVELNISDETGETNDIVCVKFSVNNFVDVEGLTFQISFNRNMVEPITPVSFPDPNVPQEFIQNFTVVADAFADQGFMRFIFFGPPAVTLPDGTILFEVCFRLIGDPGNLTPVFINYVFPNTGVTRKKFSDVPDAPVDNEDFIVKNGSIRITTNTLTVIRSRCQVTNPPLNNNGSIEFYATGSQGPYSYTVNGGAPVTGILDGQRVRLENLTLNTTYNIVVTDALGMTRSFSYFMDDTFPFTYDLIGTDPPCSNREIPLGRAEVVITDGGPYNPSDFKYSWSNFIYNTTLNAPLANGTYTVTITDPSGCTTIDSVTIFTEPIDFDVVINNEVTCAGAMNGVITINATGGTPFAGNMYSYFVNNNARGMDNTLTNIGAGNIVINVVDAVGCSFSKTIVMVPQVVLGIDIVYLDDVSCSDGFDGRISVIATGSTNFQFDLRRAGLLVFNGVNSANTYINNSMVSGTYRLTVRDAFNLGCSTTLDFTITEPTPIDISNTVVIQPSCTSNIGSIIISPTGGSPEYTYTWAHTTLNTNSLSGLGGGTYFVTVTDANGCEVTDSYVLVEGGLGNALVLNGTILSEISCKDGADGSISVEVVNGSGNSTFEWRRLNETQIISTDQTISNLSAGIYIVLVRNLDCSNLDTIILANPSGMDIAINPTIPICPGQINGIIGAIASGGNPPYNYQWRRAGSGQVVGTFSVLPAIGAGNYELTVIDANACRQDTFYELPDPPKIDLMIDGIVDVNCFGLSNGRADASASGGTTNGSNFGYLWSSSPTDSGPIATNLSAGTNWVIANDGLCVSDTVFFEIATVEKLAINFSNSTIVSPTCNGETNGSISVAAMGGDGSSYVYSWLSPVTNGPTLNNIGQGKYIVRITDSSGCSRLDSVFLTEPQPFVLNLNPLATKLLSCKSQLDGQIAVLASGGNSGPINYVWNNNITSTTNIASGLIAGNYCVTATDSRGCEADFCYALDAPPLLVGRVANPEPPQCFGGTTCIGIDFVTGGTGNKYTFQINQGIRYPIDSCVTVFAGPYRINLIDSAGCSIDTLIVIAQPDQINIDMPEGVEILLGEKTDNIIPVITAPNGIGSTTWLPLNDPTIDCIDGGECRIVQFGPNSNQTYTLVVTDENGCSSSESIEIRVKDVRNVFFPNIFAPRADGDKQGRNNYFQVVTGKGVDKVMVFEIFDRWGNKVFSKADYTPDETGTDGWDGTFNGTLLDSNVFVYYAIVRFNDGREIPYKGSVTLIK